MRGKLAEVEGAYQKGAQVIVLQCEKDWLMSRSLNCPPTQEPVEYPY